jgi:hypothetical protein
MNYQLEPDEIQALINWHELNRDKHQAVSEQHSRSADKWQRELAMFHERDEGTNHLASTLQTQPEQSPQDIVSPQDTPGLGSQEHT